MPLSSANNVFKFTKKEAATLCDSLFAALLNEAQFSGWGTGKDCFEAVIINTLL
jgi:hypothetical protein